MDVNAVTAALQDLLGPDVRDMGGWWDWGAWSIYRDGSVEFDTGYHHDDVPELTAADLDKLAEASKVVRRMVTP